MLIALGIFGTALLYGDGMITPAITVLGAIEGLEVATPLFQPYVVPITVAIRRAVRDSEVGTHRVGGLFGPIMLIWFAVLAVLGIVWIVRLPAVLSAFDPRHAIAFFGANGYIGFAVLGAVFLVVTGGEALYADMGHFGRRPIRLAWYALVLPALILNYLGQGALLLLDPTVEHPFFLLAPSWALVPLVALATAAIVIASQALISGSFSITRQAIQLGLAPRLEVEHTSAHEMGQIYVPQLNWALMCATVLIVIGFGSSTALASAYGIAVTLTMVITVRLRGHDRAVAMAEAGRRRSHGRVPDHRSGVLRRQRIEGPQGGWVTLAVALLLFTLMTTWKTGRRLVAERLTARAIPLEDFIATVTSMRPVRVPGTAVFMTAQPTGTPAALAHNLRHNKVLHEHVVVLTVSTAQQPHVSPKDRVSIEPLGYGLFNVRVQCGFMEIRMCRKRWPGRVSLAW